jgi:aminodeoxyfutalosine deaminase
VLVLEDGPPTPPFRDFLHFVDTFLASSAQVRTPADLTTVTTAFVASQAAQHVRWSETTFTAVTMEQRGWQPTAMWDALADGLASDPEVGVGLILDTPRDLGPRCTTIRRARARSAVDAGLPVVALGLTGVEGSVHEREFLHLREAADELGIGLVVHAGETGTAARTSRRDRRAARRPHRPRHRDRRGPGAARAHRGRGHRARGLPERPTSRSDSSRRSTSIPIRTLRDAGVAITVSSDDPPFFATTLTDELAHAVRLLELDELRLAALQRRAIDASFAPAALRGEVHAALDAWLADDAR